MIRPAKFVFGVLALAAAAGTVFFWTTRGEAERAERLERSGAGAKAVTERTRFLANRARAERAEAEATLETLLQPRPEDLALAEAELAAAQAAVVRAGAEAALARLRAPIAGTVIRVLARSGERRWCAGNGRPLAHGYCCRCL
jgi:multidrug resistance efflux pump